VYEHEVGCLAKLNKSSLLTSPHPPWACRDISPNAEHQEGGVNMGLKNELPPLFVGGEGVL